MANRDYRAEYQRRIDRGLEQGYTRSQAAGHPRRGETPIRGARDLQKFFVDLQNQLQDMLKDAKRVFQYYSEANCTVQYDSGHDSVLPHWYTGEMNCMPNKRDLEALWSRVRAERPQEFYALWISGTTEEEYPGKEGEFNITLSYRIHWRIIEEAINDKSHRTIVDVINAFLPEERKERWISIDQVAIVNKP